MYALVFVSILWAFSFGLIKGQLTGVDPLLVAAIRLLLCFLVFLPFYRWHKRPNKQSHFFILGMVQMILDLMVLGIYLLELQVGKIQKVLTRR